MPEYTNTAVFFLNCSEGGKVGQTRVKKNCRIRKGLTNILIKASNLQNVRKEGGWGVKGSLNNVIKTAKLVYWVIRKHSVHMQNVWNRIQIKRQL